MTYIFKSPGSIHFQITGDTVHDGRMKTIMNDDNIDTIDQVRDFLSGTREISFTLENKEQRYQFIRRTLIRFRYYNLTKPDKSILLGYLTHMTGYSRIQVKRLVLRWLKKGKLEGQPASRNGFSKRYTASDIRLLAKLDELHENSLWMSMTTIIESLFFTVFNGLPASLSA